MKINILCDYSACLTLVASTHTHTQQCNGRPLHTHKPPNQMEIPETAPFDLTFLSV